MLSDPDYRMWVVLESRKLLYFCVEQEQSSHL